MRIRTKEVLRNHKKITKALEETTEVLDKTKIRIHYMRLYEEACNVESTESYSLQKEYASLVKGYEVLILKEKMLARDLARVERKSEPTEEEVLHCLGRLRRINKSTIGLGDSAKHL